MSNIDFPPELLQKIEAVKASGGFTALNLDDLEGVSGGVSGAPGSPVNVLLGNTGATAGVIGVVTDMATELKAKGLSFDEISATIKTTLQEKGVTGEKINQTVDMLLIPLKSKFFSR